MRCSRAVAMTLATLLLSACSHVQKDNMKAQLDKIRAMVAQSSLMAAQAACMDPPARSEL